MAWFRLSWITQPAYDDSIDTRAPNHIVPLLESVRERMLQRLAMLPDVRAVSARRRVRYADDAQSLWFLRSELVEVLARHMGEQAALDLVQDITAPLHVHLPPALRPRSAPA